MRKVHRVVLALLLAVVAVFGVAVTARAADVPGIVHKSCQIPGSDFVFTYDLRITYTDNPMQGRVMRLEDIKVTDAGKGHYMHTLNFNAISGFGTSDPIPQSWGNKVTKYPRVKLRGESFEWNVTVDLRAWNNAGKPTPVCRSTFRLIS